MSLSLKVVVLVATTLAVGVLSEGDLGRDVNRGNLVHRVERSPQAPQGFPNFQPPPYFGGNPEIVAQDTDRNKNGYAQTTIYKYPNGMGSSSVSVSHSAASMTVTSLYTSVGLLTVLVAVRRFLA